MKIIFFCLLFSVGQLHNRVYGDLIAHWDFDEVDGTTVADRSGNGHHGTITGAQQVNGRVNSALMFDGTSYVEVKDAPDLRLSSDFTLMAWVKKTQPSTKGKSMGIISKSAQDHWDYDLFMSTTKLEHPALYSQSFGSPGGDLEVISKIPIALNTWIHIAVMRKESAGELYINGVLKGTAELPEPLQISDRMLRIGHDHDGGFVGAIDDVRIYDEALDKEVIQQIVAAGTVTEVPFEVITLDDTNGGIRNVGDLNNDGFPDVVHAFWYNGAPLAWYEYSSSTWKKHIIAENFYPLTDDFELADLDGDGDIDVVIAQGQGKYSDDPKVDDIPVSEIEIVWFENPHTSSEKDAGWKEHLIGAYSHSKDSYNKDIEIADFDSDGRPDIAARSHEMVVIFRQTESSSWERVHQQTIHPHEGMDVGDLDADGDPDIVLNGYWLETPSNLAQDEWEERNIDDKWWTQTGDWTANNCKIKIADVDGNGSKDVIIAQSERAGFPVSWYSSIAPAQGTWQEHVIAYMDFCHTVEAKDFDNDGDIDVLAAEMLKSEDPDRIVLFHNSGEGLHWSGQTLGTTGMYSARVSDIGADGDIDIISNRDWRSPPLQIWENKTNDDHQSSSHATEAEEVIELWYGNKQNFGQPGMAQTWANLLGRVSSDIAEVVELSYTLNGEPGQVYQGVAGKLSIGPVPLEQPRRLISAGDFNIDLDIADLYPGQNEVIIRASGNSGKVSETAVTLNYQANTSWPLPYEIDWSAVTHPQDVVQIVDGLWELTDEGLRSAEPGYDRVLAIGDASWTDYEASVFVTFHSFMDPEIHMGIQRDGIGFGLGQHWSGHTDEPEPGGQPKWGWLPVGATAWYTVQASGSRPEDEDAHVLQLDADPSAGGGKVLKGISIQPGDTYCFKIRCETTKEEPLYRCKIWASHKPEPDDWQLSLQSLSGNLSHGSLIIVAHYVDVTIGKVKIVPAQDPGWNR